MQTNLLSTNSDPVMNLTVKTPTLVGALCYLCHSLSGLTSPLYDTDAVPLNTEDGRSSSMASTPL